MSKVKIYLRLGEHFIAEDNIRALKREGTGTRIQLQEGNDIVVGINYDKVLPLVSERN